MSRRRSCRVAIARGVRHRAGRAVQGRPELAEHAAPARGGAPGAAVPRRRRAARAGCSSRSATRSTADGHAARRALPRVGREPVLHRRRCAATVRLRDLLTHLYVLIPVLDDDKHYWVGDDEVEKLLRRGEGWLADPSRARTDRPPLPEAPPRPDSRGARAARRRRGRQPTRRRARSRREAEEAAVERADQPERAASAPSLAALRNRGASACSTSAAARASCCSALLREPPVHARSSASTSRPRARDRERAPAPRPHGTTRQRERIQLLQGALTYRDARLAGFDAAALVEVIEHLDPPRLRGVRARRLRARRPGHGRRDDAERRVQRALRDACRPAASATATTASSGRAPSSRAWAERRRRDARLRSARICRSGPDDPVVGPPTQMAMFTPMTAARSPSSSLVVLVGPPAPASRRSPRSTSGRPRSSRRTTAAALVSDDENDQAATERRLRGAALHRRQAARRRPADRRRRDERAAGGAQAAGRAGAAVPRACRSRSCFDLPGASLPGAQREPARPRLRPARHPQPARSSCAARCASLRARGLSPRLRPRLARGGRRRDDRRASRSGTTAATSTGRSTSSATSMAASTSCASCSTARLRDHAHRMAAQRLDVQHPAGPQGDLPRRPGRPRARRFPACCGW